MSDPIMEELEDYEELGLPLATSTPKKTTQKKKKVPKRKTKPKKAKNKFHLAKFGKRQRASKKVCLDEKRMLLNVLATIPMMNKSLGELYGNSCFDKRTTLGSFISKLLQSKRKLLNIISSNKKKEKKIGVKM